MNTRTKGNDFELLIATSLKNWWNAEFRRTPLSGGWSAMAPGDIIVPEDFPWCIECKHSKEFRVEHILRPSLLSYLKKWWEQASNEAVEAKKEPLLVVRGERTPILCCTTMTSKIKPLCATFVCNASVDSIWFSFDWLLSLQKDVIKKTFEQRS